MTTLSPPTARPSTSLIKAMTPLAAKYSRKALMRMDLMVLNEIIGWMFVRRIDAELYSPELRRTKPDVDEAVGVQP